MIKFSGRHVSYELLSSLTLNMKIDILDKNSPYLAQVKTLGRSNASTLGFLPEGAFDQYAAQGTIIVAIDTVKNCIGYLLYRVTRGHAAIAHLCVEESRREQGIARQLVEYLKDKTKDDCHGISLRCRRDYAANNVWPRFGFVAKSELPGRGKDRKELNFWWLDHGHPTLFTEPTLENLKSKLCVVIDANVFFDLADESRPGYEESRSLLADWLPANLELCLTDEIYNEINRNKDSAKRRKSREFAQTFTFYPCETKEVDRLSMVLRKYFPENMTDRDESDLRQLARTIASGIQFFITRDEPLLIRADDIYTTFGILILRPSDFIIRFDELRKEAEYQPARLGGTLSSVKLLQSSNDPLLIKHFLASSCGESKESFKQRLHRFLANPERYRCHITLDVAQKPSSLFVHDRYREDSIEIPLFRVSRGPLTATLIRYLLFRFTLQSARENRVFTRITDPYLNADVVATLQEDEFTQNGSDWLRVNPAIAAQARDIANHLLRLDYKDEEEEKFVSEIAHHLKKEVVTFDAQTMSDVERALWPAKVLDAQIPTYIVPIRAKWAKDLFDEGLANQTLFGAIPELALNRESVYYRSKNPSGLKSPGRILWYVSQDKKYSGSGQIRACSRLDEIFVGKPKALFRQFRRLGVYEWRHIKELAKGDINQDIMALRFSDTELFTSPVKWKKLQEILKGYNCSSQIMSPVRIPTQIFAELYALGTQN